MGKPSWNLAELGYFMIQSWWVHLLPTRYFLQSNPVQFYFGLADLWPLTHCVQEGNKRLWPDFVSSYPEGSNTVSAGCTELNSRSGFLGLTFFISKASALAWLIIRSLLALIFDGAAHISLCLVSSPYIRLSSEDSIHQTFWSHPPNREQTFSSLPIVIVFIDVPRESKVPNFHCP